MATLPLVAARPRLTATQSGAIANRNGTGTIYKLFQGNTQSGSRVERITAFNMAPDGVGAANTYMCRLYIADANGNNPRLYREQTMAGYTPNENTTTAAPSESIQFVFPSGLVLGTNSSIYVGQSFNSTNQITHWICEASDFS